MALMLVAMRNSNWMHDIVRAIDVEEDNAEA